jgi:hypothetical protein
MKVFWDRPLVSDEEYVPCLLDSEECLGQITADGFCDIHRTLPSPQER